MPCRESQRGEPEPDLVGVSPIRLVAGQLEDAALALPVLTAAAAMAASEQ